MILAIFIHKAVIFLPILFFRIVRGVVAPDAVFPASVALNALLPRLLFTAFFFFHHGQGQVVKRLQIKPFTDIYEQARIKNWFACKFLNTNKILHVGILRYDLHRLLVGEVHLVLDDQRADNHADRLVATTAVLVAQALVVNTFYLLPGHGSGQFVPPVRRVEGFLQGGREQIQAVLLSLRTVFHIVAVLTVNLLFFIQKSNIKRGYFI